MVDGTELITEGSFAAGHTISGSYSFDSTASDEDPSSEVGLYRNATRFEAIVPAANCHTRTAAGSSLGFIEILDNQDAVRDRYVASAPGPFQIVSGVNLAGRPLERLAVVLRDRTTFALSSDAPSFLREVVKIVCAITIRAVGESSEPPAAMALAWDVT